MRRLTNEEKQNIISLAKKGLMVPEISKIINKSVSSVWRVLAKNGIKTIRNVVSIRRVKNCEDKDFTSEQYEILYGTLLGDSSLQLFNKKSKTPAYTCCHSESQKEYSFLLSEKLNGVCNRRERYDKRTNKTYISYDVRTKTNPHLLPIYNELYKTGKKQVTKEYAEKLTARSIAFWFMDDGYKHDETFILCTDSFSIESCDILCETMFKKFGITFRKLKHGNNYRLRLIYDDRKNFISLISPFLIDSMKYKIDVDTTYKKHTINFRLNTKTFVEKAMEVHGNTYDYSKTVYGKNNVEKVIITCKKHGDFLQTPLQHLNGHGCQECGKEKRGKNKCLGD